MKIKIQPSKLSGQVSAPPSKSFAHRMMICAALADGESIIHGISESEDMLATIDCIEAIGAHVRKDGDTVYITGRTSKTPDGAILRCRESGSTLRFMIPLSLNGERVRFEGTPRLLARGIGIYEDILTNKDISIRKDETGIEFCGRLKAGEYILRGDVSSQFVSGLMFALPLLDDDNVIRVLPPVESKAYINITVAVLKSFGIEVCETEENTFFVKGSQRYSAGEKTVEGDWSNAAALEAFNYIGGQVSVDGLNYDSIQGDKVCLKYLDSLRHKQDVLDLSNCPDLGPVLFAAAAAIGRGAEFTGTKRLRIKESDRAAAMAQELEAFGIETELYENSFIIKPGIIHTPTRLLSSHNDHRIVMALTLLCSLTGGVIDGVEAVRKSFPDYFETLRTIGLEAEYEA